MGKSMLEVENHCAETGDTDVPFLAPAAPENITGHKVLLSKLVHRLVKEGTQRIFVLCGLPGMGKTTLAAYVAQVKEVHAHFCDGVLWAGLGVKPNLHAQLREWALALGIPRNEIGREINLEQLRAMITGQIREKRMLIVIDDVWQIEHIQTFMLGGPGCAYLITTRRTDVDDQTPYAETIGVPELTEEESLSLLARLAPEAVRAGPDQIRELARVIGGMPLALVLMGKYLWKEAQAGQRRRLQSAFHELQNAEQRLKLEMAASPLNHPSIDLTSMPLSVIAAIRVSDETLDPDARRALRALSIFQAKPNRFTQRAALDVSRATVETLQSLVDAGLLETDGDCYTMNRVVGDYANYYMAEFNVDAKRLHRRAADSYNNWLVEYEGSLSDATPYLREFRYVDSEWQNAMFACSYHMSQADPTFANLIFANTYFDSFWWWGCYRNFPYCDMLLEDRPEQDMNSQLDQWMPALRTFHKSYPVGYNKVGKGNWEKVEQALLKVRRLGGADGELTELELAEDPELNELRIHLRGITGPFLAESRRYRDVNDSQADRYYEESLQIFRTGTSEKDTWNIPWMLWHLADLYLERELYDQAREKAIESRMLVIKDSADACERDNEIISNDHRVEADTYWQQGDVEQSMFHYARAVFYAYAFLGCPIPPNFYTRDFYAEMTTRALDLVEDLWEKGQSDEAISACQFFHDFWKPYWIQSGRQVNAPANGFEALFTENQRQNLEAYLFPAAPSEADMIEKPEKFAEEVQGVFHLMVHSIEGNDNGH